MSPQPPKQQPELGFPLARIGVLRSLATGACHNLTIAAYSGKGTGETSLFGRVFDTLKPGDVVVADALFDNNLISANCVSAVSISLLRSARAGHMSRIWDTRARGQRSVWVMLVGPSVFIDPIDVENEGERKLREVQAGI